MIRVLLLGGTTEAHALARALASAGIGAVYSYAGRTAAPVVQPLPTRHGGFGGAEGLAQYIRAEAISHVVDATHPFAAGISANAARACAQTGTAPGTALIVLQREAWRAGEGDLWTDVPDLAAAAAALPESPARVFLAIGRQGLAGFAARPQHHYLLRLVDAPTTPLPLPDCTVTLARGPFTAAGDRALMEAERITHVVAKNSGGSGARAKLEAARALSLPVIMIARPAPDTPPLTVAGSTGEVLHWLAHGTLRGV